MSEPTQPADVTRDGVTSTRAAGSAEPEAPPVVDYAATWRRLRRTMALIGGAIVVLWLVRGALDGGLSLRVLGELVGLGLLLSFAVEAVVVGGSAIRGMLAAGERGDRLSSPDVSLLPPQVGRRRSDR